MWIVRLALGRPYTFVVLAVLIVILGGTAIVTMAVDVIPYIDVRVVSVLYAYGLSRSQRFTWTYHAQTAEVTAVGCSHWDQD